MKPNIFSHTSTTGRTMHQANVRIPGQKPIYLGTHPTREEAQAAADHYLATGERPAKKRRGPKRGQPQRNPCQTPHQRQPRAAAPRILKSPNPSPASTQIDRLSMMREIARRLAA